MSNDLDAGALAFYVRDLMAAAGYHYAPSRELHEQVRECDDLIRTHRHDLNTTVEQLVELRSDSKVESQRLTDLVTELRRQLESALRIAEDPTILEWRRSSATIPTPAEWNALVAERDALRPGPEGGPYVAVGAQSMDGRAEK